MFSNLTANLGIKMRSRNLLLANMKIFIYNSGSFNHVVNTRQKHVVQNTTVIQSAIDIPCCSFSLNGNQSHGGLQNPACFERIRGGLHGNEGVILSRL